MRVSDDRYRQDVRRHDLAVRLIRHHARVHTVSIWTGLSPSRVKRLGQTYVPKEDQPQRRRMRGPSPRRFTNLLQMASLRAEAAALSGLCKALGAIPSEVSEGDTRDWRGLATGERACYAFELYRQVIPDSSVTLEQLLALLVALAKSEELGLERCHDCDAAILVDLLGVQRRLCSHCKEERARGGVPLRVPVVGGDAPAHEESSGWAQGSLF